MVQSQRALDRRGRGRAAVSVVVSLLHASVGDRPRPHAYECGRELRWTVPLGHPQTPPESERTTRNA